MISQGQGKEKHPLTKKRRIIHKEDWRKTNILLVILGIEIPLIGGFWIWNNYPWYYALFLTVLLGALLIRSWWALLIVPTAFATGITLGILLFPFLQGGWPMLQDRLNSGMEGLDILIVMGGPALVLLTIFGTWMGVSFGKWIYRHL